MLRISARLEAADDFIRTLADVDKSGKVNSKDARTILRAAAKLETLPDETYPEPAADDPAAPTEEYTVTFVVNMQLLRPIEDQKVAAGGTAEEPAFPESIDHTQMFSGWYADEALTVEFDFSAPITKDTSVYAKWTFMDDRPIINDSI